MTTCSPLLYAVYICVTACMPGQAAPGSASLGATSAAAGSGGLPAACRAAPAAGVWAAGGLGREERLERVVGEERFLRLDLSSAEAECRLELSANGDRRDVLQKCLRFSLVNNKIA